MPCLTPARSALPLWTALNREWQFLTESATAHHELLRWHRLYPPLAAAGTLADLKPAIDADPTLLAPLVRLHQSGSQLASKALLFAMMGKLVRLSRHAGTRTTAWVRNHSNDDRAATTVAAFLDIASTQNPDSTNVAAALALRTLTAIQAHTTFDNEACVDDVVGNYLLNARTVQHAPEPDARTLIDNAHHDGRITTAERTLLIAAYLSSDTPNQAALAEQMHITYPALRRRLSRAVAHLRDAVNPALADAS